MTDKQIIIDGVDVGWCKNYNEANSKDCETLYICKENPNCYYKQYKRKEQECEELKGDLLLTEENLKDYIEHFNKASNELDQLKAENKELKKCYKNNSALLDFEETNTTKLVNKVMKLEKTLAEIKEIAERGFKHSQCNCGAKADLDLILQKISEVLE